MSKSDKSLQILFWVSQKQNIYIYFGLTQRAFFCEQNILTQMQCIQEDETINVKKERKEIPEPKIPIAYACCLSCACWRAADFTELIELFWNDRISR